MKTRWLLSLTGVLLCSCVAQTGDLSAPGLGTGTDGDGATNGGGRGGDLNDAGRGSTSDAAAGPPLAPYCIVRQMITARCVRCHANPPMSGAPMPLVTYPDLLVPAGSNPTRIVAEVALERIRSATFQMPPSPAPRATPVEIQALRDWLNGGTPQSSCSGAAPTGAADGGRDGP